MLYLYKLSNGNKNKETKPKIDLNESSQKIPKIYIEENNSSNNTGKIYQLLEFNKQISIKN